MVLCSNKRSFDNQKTNKTKNTHVLLGVPRLVVLGNAKVGKTSLINRFVHNDFDEKRHSTIEELVETEVMIKGKPVNVEIIDTVAANNLLLNHIKDLYVTNFGHGFMFVYSITDKESYEKMMTLKADILALFDNPKKCPMVVVGNKHDLEKERVVSEREGRLLGEHVSGCGYKETSALENFNVKQAFTEVLEQIETGQPEKRNLAQKIKKGAITKIKQALKT